MEELTGLVELGFKPLIPEILYDFFQRLNVLSEIPNEELISLSVLIPSVDKITALILMSITFTTKNHLKGGCESGHMSCYAFRTNVLILYNYYNETGLDGYHSRAEDAHQVLLKKLEPHKKNRLLGLEMELVPTFFTLERRLSAKLRRGDIIDDREVQEFTLRKSTDVFLYAAIAAFVVPIPKQVADELYYQQLLQDFDDDHRDLAEDFEQRMPNPLIMRFHKRGLIDFNRHYSQGQLEELAKRSGVYDEHKAFVESYVTELPQVKLK